MESPRSAADPEHGEDGDSAIETESNCSYEETAAKIEQALRRSLKLDQVDGDSHRTSAAELTVDVKSLPGYQEIPSNCPAWKKLLIEKKNKQLEEDALQELLTKKQEEDRWTHVPEWKKQIILDKERKKQQQMAERLRQKEQEMERLKALPEWKRNLVIKKRGNDTS